MPSQPDISKIAAILVDGDPLNFKAYPDGTLAVIAPSGQKFKFTPEQVQAASHSITPKPEPKPSPQPEPDPKPDPKPASKPASKRGRPPKTKPESK
jgi:outer membrane biosynthesis protein TonB